MIICTIAAGNYVSKAACLAASLAETQPQHQFLLCLLERDRSSISAVEQYFSQVVLASEIGIPNFSSFIFRHDLIEACTAVKAQFLLWAMHRFPEEQNFIYLDPDVMPYSRFEELEAMLPQAEIVVTPHLLRDEDSTEGIRDNTFRTLIAGAFNLGFLALRRSQTALKFLEWWNRKLQVSCYMEWMQGLFVDQKWVLLGLSFFDMTVLREPGYNVANWNIAKRCLTKGEKPGDYLVQGQPLRFVHFSSIDIGRDMYYFRKYLRDDNPIFAMREEYIRKVSTFNPPGASHVPWSYGSFLSGESIGQARYFYRRNPKLIAAFPEPFKESSSAFFSATFRPPQKARA